MCAYNCNIAQIRKMSQYEYTQEEIRICKAQNDRQTLFDRAKHEFADCNMDAEIATNKETVQLNQLAQ